MSFDKMASDAAMIDARFRASTDSPECFLCGKKIPRKNLVTVETQASIGMHAHYECANGMSVVDLYARLWKAIRAAMEGSAETENPNAPIVNGDFS